jgi:hypothetical protein
MSKKTMKQRIALVAVSALTAGLFSVVSTPAANAATSVDAITGTFCQWYDSAGAVTATDANVTTIVVPVAGSFTVSLDDAATNIVTVSSPGIITAVTTGSGNSVAANGLSATVTALATDTITIQGTAVGTFKIKTATEAAPGTIVDEITVSVVASCSSGTVSESDSQWAIATAVKSSVTDLQKELDSTYTFVDDGTAYLSFAGYNAYGATSPTGTWTATATGDNVVLSMSATCTLSAGDINTAALSADGTNADDTCGTDGDSSLDPGIWVRVDQKTSGTAVTTTLSLSFNGTVVLSRSIKFTGDLASITVSGVDVQNVTGSLTGLYDVLAKDAAGNLIARTVSGDSAKYNSTVTNVVGGTTETTGTGALSAATWTCGDTGKATVRLKGTTNAGTTVYSNDFTAACGSTVYSYTASLDKAVYSAGDIATLTVTAKDAAGGAPYKNLSVGASSTAAGIAGSQMTAINTPATSDVWNASGVKIYTFTVGSTAGKYNMAVNLGYTSSTAPAVSIPYEVKGSGEVTNAEVLKSIVALIASINKQIQALQKLILKR